MPSWLRGDVLDVRKVVSLWAVTHGASENQNINKKVCSRTCVFWRFPVAFSSYWQFPPHYYVRSLNITQQLRALRLGLFQGRAHCGIDVSIHHVFSFVHRVDCFALASKPGRSEYRTYHHRARQARSSFGTKYPDKSQQAMAMDGEAWRSLGILSHLNSS